MNNTKKSKLFSQVEEKCFFDECSIFGKVLHYWNWQFYVKNFNKEIGLKNIPKCSKDDLSEDLTNELEHLWNLEQHNAILSNKKPSLFHTVAKLFLFRFTVNFLISLVPQIALVIQACIMGNLIRELSTISSSDSKNGLWMKAFAMIFCQFVHVNAINYYGTASLHNALKLKVALIGLMYKKLLKMSKSAFLTTSQGQVINLIANDINKLEWSMFFIPYSAIAVLLVILVACILWNPFGISILISLVVLVFFIPIQIYIGKLFSDFIVQAAKLTDERIRLMNEFIPAIKIIKYYCWELKFAEKINKARKAEIAKIRLGSYAFAINMGLFNFCSKLIIYSFLTSYVLLGNILDPDQVFIAFTLLNQMTYIVVHTIPYILKQIANTFASLNRIESFLLLQETEGSKKTDTQVYGDQAFVKVSNLFGTYDQIDENQIDSQNKAPSDSNDSDKKLSKRVKQNKSDQYELKNLDQNKNFKAKKCSNYKIVLNDISFDVYPGELLSIVGPVGSGKSSCLMATLKEMNSVNKESVDIQGRISYSSQDPYTFEGTIRDNILFGNEFNEEKYEKVIRVCSLRRDMTLFPRGDQTMVGEKGSSLSGGQRARLNLARALYHDADIYLLDDPLSAVDPSVAKNIFKEAIQGYLKDKITVLVTHQLQFVKNSKKVLLIDNGCQVAFGNFDTISKSGVEFAKFIDIEIREPNQPNQSNRSVFGSLLSLASETNSPRLSLESTSIDMEMVEQLKERMKELEDEKLEKRRTIKEISTLQFTSKIYYVYLKLALSSWLGPCLLFSLLSAQIVFTFSDYFLSLWVDSQSKSFDDNNKNTSLIEHLNQEQIILIYTSLIFVLLVLSLSKAVLFFKACLASSVKLHNRLFKKVVGSPMSFFENNSQGILLNRVSRDTGIVDEVLPTSFYESVDTALVDFGICFMTIWLNAYLVFPVLLLGLFVIAFRHFYLKTAKYVRMLEGVAKSPLIQQISSTFNGLVSIRAFHQGERYNDNFSTYQNDHTSAYFMYILGVRWFVFALDSLQIIFLSGVLIVIIEFSEHLNQSTIGLILSSILLLTHEFHLLIKDFSEVEIQFTSVERLDQYSNLPQEPALESAPDKKPPRSWPQSGRIEFKNVNLKYFEDEKPVLKNLSFTIEPKEHIGVVGRTGAGKSSIIGALFRMYDFEGDIIIDGVNIKEIGLHDLRKKISIIPQDAILFSGTIRSNLDPLNEIKDDQILWDSLRATQLDKPIRQMDLGLESVISDSGNNFSAGQKQLICLARAMLRGNRILVLDEATANCDPKTDELIQATIRNVFKDCSIITIAHRLNTIIDSDKILVMDAGENKEYDSPQNLLKDNTSMFTSLVDATGKESARYLKRMANLNDRKDQYLKEEV